jgi:hypothetical protein
MARKTDKYRRFVEHPRYGRRPNITGLNPNPNDPGVFLHWNAVTPEEFTALFQSVPGRLWPYGDFRAYYNRTKRIPNTAIAANLGRQSQVTFPVTHYFDLERKCRNCNRPFIFFADEQLYWYDHLGFVLQSDCIHCLECRSGIAHQREIYGSLFLVSEKTDQEALGFADSCLSLIEHDVFARRDKSIEQFRLLLALIPDDAVRRNPTWYLELVRRGLAVDGVAPLR